MQNGKKFVYGLEKVIENSYTMKNKFNPVKEGDRMNDLKLSQLRYFCEVCNTGSVTRAANNLHITQPSISAAIRNLETAYALTLFYREKGRLSLTREGSLLYERAKVLLGQADDLDSKLRALGTQRMPIRIGVSPMISIFLFLPIFNQFHRRHPEIALEMYEFGSLESIRQMQDHQIDMAIIIENSQAATDFLWMPLMETSLLYCVSRNHRLADARSVRIEELENERLIMMRATSHQTSTLVNQRFAEAGITPNILLQSNQITLIRRYIQTYNAGAFLMEAFMSQCMKEDQDVVGIPLDPPIRIPIGLIRNHGERPSQQAFVFLDFLSEAARRGTLQQE